MTELEELCDKFYDIADKYLKTNDLCSFRKGGCIGYRRAGAWQIINKCNYVPMPKESCCKQCNLLGPNGCTTKNVWCKLYACGNTEHNNKKAYDGLAVIRRDFKQQLYDKFKLQDSPRYYFCSKEVLIKRMIEDSKKALKVQRVIEDSRRPWKPEGF